MFSFLVDTLFASFLSFFSLAPNHPDAVEAHDPDIERPGDDRLMRGGGGGGHC